MQEAVPCKQHKVLGRGNAARKSSLWTRASPSKLVPEDLFSWYSYFRGNKLLKCRVSLPVTCGREFLVPSLVAARPPPKSGWLLGGAGTKTTDTVHLAAGVWKPSSPTSSPSLMPVLGGQGSLG